MNNKLKIIFFGTPEFAVPFLKSLIQDDFFDVVGVITQPDKPVGRKQVITPPPVKELVQENNLSILQPEKLRNNPEIIEKLKALKPDLFVVVAYGLIIPQEILDIPAMGSVNVHPSLLPKYRGPSPIQSAILNGDDITGVSIMLLDEQMDHGPILAQQELSLTGQETAESLHDQIAEIAPDFMIKTIKKYANSEIKPQEQDHDKATYCQIIKKDQAKIDWTQPAEVIERQIRGYYSWPVAWTEHKDKRIKIFPPVEVIDIKDDLPIGQITKLDDNLIVPSIDEEAIKINKLQPEGRSIISAEEFLRGGLLI